MYLPPRELAVLRLLLARAGEIVSPLEVKRALWDEKDASSDTLSRCFTSLRARLGPADCIQSVYRRGYRITVAVEPDGPPPGGKLPRLAILPFAARIGVPDYLGMAVTEEAMERLQSTSCAVASLVAQDSVFTLARRGMAAQEIGTTLQADLVLTGQLLTTPGHDRLRAEMIRVRDGAQLWVEDMIVERGRIGALTAKLVNRLICRLHLGGLSIAAAAESAAQVESSPNRREANELFLRAHHGWQTFERHRMQDALGDLLRAIELDPALMKARVDLANLSITQAIYGVISPVIEAGIVRRAAERIPLSAANGAGSVDALLPSLGWVDFHVDHNLLAALKAFARSAHLPHDPLTTRARAMFALSRHRFGEAIDLLRAAIVLDPYAPSLQARLAWALHLAGEAADSVAQARKALELFPWHDGALLFGAIILSYNGKATRAVELRDALAARSLHFDINTATYAYVLACDGRADEARAQLERLQWLSRERFVLNTLNAAAYVALGEPDAALAELRVSLENRCPWFFQVLADPRLKPLHGRPEFEEMRAILTAMEAGAERTARD